MAKIRGVWTPDINYNELEKALLLALASKQTRLTGGEISFIRKYFEMSTHTNSQNASSFHTRLLSSGKTPGVRLRK